MKKIKDSRYIKALWIVMILVLLYYLSTNTYFTFIGINSIINAIAVIGIVIITGYANQLQLGQSAFLGIGAYTSAILMTKSGLSFWMTIPLAMLLAGIFGWLLSFSTLRLKGNSYLALVTQTFGEIIYILLLNLEEITNGPFGISGINAPKIGTYSLGSLRKYFFLCLIFLIIVYVITKNILNSKYGLFFKSIKDAEEASQSIGININKYKMIAFVFATTIAGLAGVLYGPFIGYLSPDQFRWQPSLTLVSMAIVGGMGSIEGGIIGAVLLTFLPELLRFTDELRMIIFGLVVILTLAFLPDGIVSLIGKPWKEIKKSISDRKLELSGKSIRKRKGNKTYMKTGENSL